MEKPIFQTKLTKIDYSILFLLLGGLIFCFVYYDFFINFNLFELFLVFCGWIIVIYRIISIQVFILFPDRLIIRKPFLLTYKFDVIYSIKEIRNISFVHIGQRYGGSYRMNVAFFSKVDKENKNYQFDNGFIQLKEFIENLKLVGIKIKGNILM